MNQFTIIVASNNSNKIKEIQAIFKDLDLKILTYQEYFGKEFWALEDQLTFSGNAQKKVLDLPLLPKIIYLSDDSGLEVDYLNGAPGVFSSRYAGPGASSKMLSEKILSELGDSKIRGAQFRCCLALKFPNDQISLVEGIVRGRITKTESGKNGFGYDPIFIPRGEKITFAQMTSLKKNQLSHRYRALVKAKTEIEHWLKKHNLNS